MADLVIAGQIMPMDGDVPAEPRRGRVWIRGDAIVDVTTGTKRVAGFGSAPEVDVGDAYVLPGFIDMHNHLAYNALPLWREPGRTEPWMHNKHWPNADSYTASITEPAWTYAKACPEALLAYVQVRALAGGATAIQGWPAANKGYPTVLRNVDAEKAGTTTDDLIYTSVVTKTGEALATSVRRMRNDHAGFIYHCAEGRRGSRVTRDYTDLARAAGLRDLFIGIHCCAVDAAGWDRWPLDSPGGVVWSPLSNIVLYAETTLVDHARARGVRVCLGSDWGPSGTKNLLGEMKVARIASDRFGFGLTDRDIVQMVTSNPGVLLERCWSRPVGRLVPDAFADVTVIRGHGRGSPWRRILTANEQHVELVVARGEARYGTTTSMRRAASPEAFRLVVRDRVRMAALPDRADPQKAWSWGAIVDELTAVQRDPQQAIADAAGRRASAGALFGDDADLELFLDMPDPRRTGRAGPPKDLATVRIPEVPSIEHDADYFDLLEAAPIQAGILDDLRKAFAR